MTVARTAHYTSWVWYRNGLSDPALATADGERLYRWMGRAEALYGWFSRGPGLEQHLLARHALIDRRLREAIDAGEVGQVLEIAAGLSPRGLRFARERSDVTFVETDLPDQLGEKASRLRGIAPLNHRLVALDAAAADGPLSLDAVASNLDPTRGIAILTEGLLGYLPPDVLRSLWTRIARTLTRFPSGVYLSDLTLARGRGFAGNVLFDGILKVFVRGSRWSHFADPASVEVALRDAGFGRVRLHDPGDHPGLAIDAPGSPLRVIEARAR